MKVSKRITEKIVENQILDYRSNHLLLKMLDYVSMDTGISISSMQGKNRKREIVFARQIYCWLVNKYIKKGDTPSFATVGSLINKDHATVIHAIKTVNNLIETNKYIKKRVNQMELKAKIISITNVNAINLKKSIALNAVCEAAYPINSRLSYLELQAYIAEGIVIERNESALIPTGITVNIPEGYHGIIESIICDRMEDVIKSGSAELFINVQNSDELEIIIEPFQKIANFVLVQNVGFCLVNND